MQHLYGIPTENTTETDRASATQRSKIRKNKPYNPARPDSVTSVIQEIK